MPNLLAVGCVACPVALPAVVLAFPPVDPAGIPATEWACRPAIQARALRLVRSREGRWLVLLGVHEVGQGWLHSYGPDRPGFALR